MKHVLQRRPVIATPEEIGKYEPVIGLEVHVQLNTRTKIFAAAPPASARRRIRTSVRCAWDCRARLPVLNRRAVEMAIQAALATHCRSMHFRDSRARITFIRTCPRAIRSRNMTSRWPSTAGWNAAVDGAKKRIGITRIHLEDDAGKSIHDGFKDSDRYTYVDLNRSGTPLIEIVSEPDIRRRTRLTRF
jgi:aspartyl-tRNA(Asn)/glutamyl-tRNA(Gln) amidotransferase subunit B